MDYENLSKEELIKMLKLGKSDNSKLSQNILTDNTGKACIFKPTKTGIDPCKEPVCTDWGFCKKHSKTIQARKAQEVYEASIIQKSNSTKHSFQNEQKKPDSYESPKKHAPIVRKKHIGPNKWGRFEDPDTHIVFDPRTVCAYGVQEPNGKIICLTPKHIAICEKNKWKYTKPVKDSDEESDEESSSENSDEDAQNEEEEDEEEEEEEEEEDEEEEEEEEDEEEEEHSDSE